MANKVLLTCRLGADPELKQFDSGVKKARLRGAVHVGKKDNERTLWIRIEGWEQTADTMMQFKKGQLVTVQGRLDVDSWTDKTTGQPRSEVKVVASEIAAGAFEAGEAPASRSTAA